MVVAIHQPNFLPWLGYFNKIARSDQFVFLDEVDFPRTSRGNAVNRVEILLAGQRKWLTSAILREGARKINEIYLAPETKERNLNKIKSAYAKAPYFKSYIGEVESIVMSDFSRLYEYNIHAIKRICDWLGIKREFILQSEIKTHEKSEWLMIEIAKKLGAMTYLSGSGARKYQNTESFESRGVRLVYQDFKALPYAQGGEFCGGLSVIDALFYVGESETKRLILEGFCIDGQ